MDTITDEHMRQSIAATKNYCIVILKAGPNKHKEGVESIIWEHGRRNFALRAEGVLPIVCPISDGSDVSGIGIFNASKLDPYICFVSSEKSYVDTAASPVLRLKMRKCT